MRDARTRVIRVVWDYVSDCHLTFGDVQEMDIQDRLNHNGANQFTCRDLHHSGWLYACMKTERAWSRQSNWFHSHAKTATSPHRLNSPIADSALIRACGPVVRAFWELLLHERPKRWEVCSTITTTVSDCCIVRTPVNGKYSQSGYER